MENILNNIGKQVDQDIWAFMFKDSDRPKYQAKVDNLFHKNWELMKDPIVFMFSMQELRDRNHARGRVSENDNLY